MTIELSEYVIDAIADAVVKKMQEPILDKIRAEIERYKPIILQEHDAEPRRLKAILDVETNDIYVHKITRGTAECIGLTIEDRQGR